MYKRRYICRINSKYYSRHESYVKKRTGGRVVGSEGGREGQRGVEFSLGIDIHALQKKSPEFVYKINEDLKVQFRILVSIGNEQIPHSRGICLQVKYKLKFVLIYYVEVKQQIWINVQKFENLKLQSRKYDL